MLFPHFFCSFPNMVTSQKHLCFRTVSSVFIESNEHRRYEEVHSQDLERPLCCTSYSCIIYIWQESTIRKLFWRQIMLKVCKNLTMGNEMLCLDIF